MGVFSFFMLSSLAGQNSALLDDFRDPERSVFGTQWEGYTDQVMGGLSSMDSGVMVTSEGNYLRMSGRVKIENNGGFIQMRLPLEKGGKFTDARNFTGIRLLVRGTPGSYAVHLRTSWEIFPWSFHTLKLSLNSNWTEVRLPFAEFKGDYGARSPVDVQHLKGVSVVAIGQAFTAQLELKEIGFYK